MAILRRVPEGPLQLTADEEIELLVGAPELHVGPHGDRIVTLAQGVQQLMDPDGLATAVALLEVVPFQHPGNGVLRRKANHAVRPELAHPDRVEADLGELGVQNLEHLTAVRVRIALELLPAQRFSSEVPAARIADEAGEVADQEHHVMAKLLELAHLVEKHGVPEVEVGRGGVEAGLDAKRFTAFEFRNQILLHEDLVHTSADDGKRVIEPGQGSSPNGRRARQVITAPRATRLTAPSGPIRRRIGMPARVRFVLLAPVHIGWRAGLRRRWDWTRVIHGRTRVGARFVQVAVGKAGR